VSLLRRRGRGGSSFRGRGRKMREKERLHLCGERGERGASTGGIPDPT
jgi:hypothetical protein